MSQGLTTNQANLLDLLRSSERTPSYAEMARALGIKSKSMVFKLIDGLEERGFVERLPNKSRAVRLIERPEPWTDIDVHLAGVSTKDLIAELRRRGGDGMTDHGKAWPEPERAIVRTALLEGKSAREIGAITGRSPKAVLCGVQRYALGEWLSLKPRAMPEGFAEDAKVMGLTRLMEKHQCGRANAKQWRADLGIVAVQRKRKPVKLRVVKTRPAKPPWPRKESKETFTRAPIERAPKIAKPGHMTAPVDRGYKEDSAAGEAQRVLQRDGWKPVVRCTQEGRQDAKGRFWICGRSVAITDAELIERAGGLCGGWRRE